MESKFTAMAPAAGAALGAGVSRNSSLASFSRISSTSSFARLSRCAMAQSLIPRFFVLFVLFVAKIMAAADVVVDGTSEIVLPADAPYATRLAAEELNFFLKGVLGAPLPVVERRTAGKTAIVLGGSNWESRHLGGV